MGIILFWLISTLMPLIFFILWLLSPLAAYILAGIGLMRAGRIEKSQMRLAVLDTGRPQVYYRKDSGQNRK